MNISHKQTLWLIAILIAGLCLPLAFAPFNYWVIAFISPLILLASWYNVTPRQAMFRGLVFGLGFFGVGISWVYISMNTFGGMPIALSLFITTLFVAFLSLFIALQGYLTRKFFNQQSPLYFLVFPSLWVLFEWTRTWLFTGFPWLFLGYSQLSTPLKNLAPIGSVYLVSFGVALTASTLVYLFTSTRKLSRIISIALIIVIWGSSIYLNSVSYTHNTHKKLSVALIQGNVKTTIKWDPKEIIHTLKLYHTMTEKLWGHQLIIWPEAAIAVLPSQIKDYINTLQTEATQHNTTIMTGIPLTHGFNYYNGIMLLGNSKGTYLKRHLVPFGEYIPFEKYVSKLFGAFNIPMSNLSPGAFHQPLLRVDNIPIAPYICYEIAYPAEVRNTLKNAQLIVTLTDDGWFGHSFASAQHLQIAAMRSLETGRYQALCTNNGITAIINDKGHIVSTSPRFKRTVLTGQIPLLRGTTPWQKIGEWPLILCLFSLLLLAYFIPTRP